MNGGAVTKYFATLGFKVDKKELANIDRTLSNLEKKLRSFGKNIDKHLNLTFKVDKIEIDKVKLRNAVGNALDFASKNTVFELSRFAVNDRALQSALMRGMRMASGRVRPSPTPPAPAPNPVPASPAQETTPQRTRSRQSYSRANYLHAGGAVGALARYGVASLPFVGGVYGLSAMNQGIQEIQSTEIAANSIFGDRSDEARRWLEQQADYVGFNYLETLPIFSSFMASSMPLIGFEQSQGVFEAISQFGRTRGADSVSMKRAMTAIQQMASKGQVMAEELKNQLSEAKGFGESRQIFAEAYQMSIGGNLQGAEASAALMDAMQKGDVKAGDILPLVAQIMKARSAGGIEQARMSLTAEQMRFQNEQTRQLKAFGESGGIEGYARIFRAMTIALKEAEPLVRSFARGFNEASKFVTEVLLNVQSIQRFFQGRDSWFGDTFFGTEERRNAAFQWLGSIKTLMGEIGDLVDTIFRGWGMIFDLLMSSEVMNALTNIQNTFTNIIGAINSMANGDYTGAMQQMKAAFLTSDGYGNKYYDPAAHRSSLEAMKDQTAADRRKAGFPGTLGVFPMSQEEQATRAMRGTGSYGTSSLNNVVVESGAIIVNTQATDGDKLAEELRPHLQQMFRVEQTRTFTEAMLMVPQKE